jgi:hypothetical protein
MRDFMQTPNGDRMKTLDLEPSPPVIRDNRTRFSCRLIRRDDNSAENTTELWYEIPKKICISWRNEDVEPYLIATILQAMHEGRTIVARGTVSAELLSNLTEFCDFWNCCAPEYFKKIEIVCDRIETSKNTKSLNKAIAGFSGGLDGTFLVWRHITKQAGHRTQPLSSCVMIHGFDIPLVNEAFFNKNFAAAKKTLDAVGLPLISIRTNILDVVTVHILYSQNTALVSSLQFLKSKFDIALIASAESYNNLLIPWGGSLPLNDPLLSSRSLKVLHDGAGYSRSEKAKCIADWADGIAALRVCWSTEFSSALNCGRCEKCLRTMANFAVHGLPIPACLNGDLDTLNAELRFLKLRSRAQEAEWKNLLKQARNNGVQDPWAKAIPRLLKKYTIRKRRKEKKHQKKELNPFRM